MKNIIFLIAVRNKDFEKKYCGFGWFEYAIKSWTYWCERNNAELVIYETPKNPNIKDFRDSKLKDFRQSLKDVLLNLAKRIAADGVGASIFISIK